MKTYVISLGGSLIVPDEVDTGFLKEFKELVDKKVEEGNKFVIYCGGGSIARKYQKAYSEVVDDNSEAQDWIGISATHLNAFLVQTVFHEHACEEIIQDPTKKIKFDKPIAFAGGWKPGWSTDYDAIMVAKQLGAESVINMSNIEYVYDADPKKDKNAKPIKEISWPDFRKIVGDEWKPGLNMPFDPIAAKEADGSGITVYVVGKDLKNLLNVLDEKEFIGTKIE